MKKKIGRPQFPDELRRESRILLSFTAAERELLERVAADEPLATYVRRLVLRHLAHREKKR